MALPQKVLDQLSREPPETPGWSFSLLMFSGGMLLIAVFIYFGLTFGYEPYLSSQIASLNNQMNTLAASVSPADQAKLVTFYSEITNLKTILAGHVVTSRFFSWLEQNTEANIYYSAMTFNQGDQVSLTAFAASEADINQQMAIFEAAPAVTNAVFSGAQNSPVNGKWQFTAILTLDPTAVLRVAQTAPTQ